MAATNQAERERLEDQDNYPSRGGLARVERACALLDRRRWAVYRARHEPLRSTVILVSGRLAPRADTVFYDDGSTYLRINDGLVDHLDTVCRVIAASGRFASDEGVAEEPALTPPEVDAKLKQTYDDWRARERNEPVERIEVPLGPRAATVAEGLGSAAIVFTVLHEFGHAALHRAGARVAVLQEPEADRWAAEALFANAKTAASQPNYLLGGALLSIRALASRERMYKPDLHGYPPSEQRFAELLAMAQRFSSDPLSFYVRTTLAFSLDQRMQRAEHDFGAGQQAPPSRPEQLLSTIVAVLVEAADGHMSFESAAATLLGILAVVSPGVVAATAALGATILFGEQPSCLAEPRVRRVVELYERFTPRLQQAAASHS